MGITGALVCTERNFVQFIEGPDAAIADLLGKIRADRRHARVNVLEDTRAEDRHFHGWSLAYSGPDAYIDYDLVPLMQHGEQCPELAVALRTRLHAMANA